MTSQSSADRQPGRLLERVWSNPHLVLSAAALFWASNFIVGRAIPDGLAPVSLSFWRWVLALPLAYAAAAPHLQRDWPAIRRNLPILTLLAATGVAGSNTAAYLGLQTATATTALLVQSAVPVTILLFGFLLFRERAGLLQLAAMGLALAGVLLVIEGRSGGGAAQWSAGTVLVVGAMMLQSLYATLLRCAPQMHPTSLLFATFALAALLLLPVQLWAGTPLPMYDASGMAALCYLALGPSILAFFCFNRGVALIGSGRAAVFFYLMPVFGTLIAVPVLGETIGLVELGGFALVGVGFVLSRRRRPA